MRSIYFGNALLGALTALTLTACGSSGMGDILGTPDTGSSNSRVAGDGEVRGTVRYVDTSGDCVIELEDSRFTRGTSYLRDDDTWNSRDGERATVYCDDRTVVMHEGKSYEVGALERGDEIVVEVDESGNRLLAGRIDVLYDVTGDDRADDDRDSLGGGDLRGTVVRVDRENRTLLLEDVRVYDRQLDDWEGDRVTLEYDTDTDVLFEGQRYSAENLEAGDEVEVEAYEVRGRLIAESIEVVADARASRF
jgi:uncharacterized protein YuzE